MSRRRKWLKLAAFALLVLALAAILAPEREPTYQGRSYSDWLAQADWEMREHEGDDDPDTEGFHALRQIGTNAVPILLKWVKRRPEPWRERLGSWLEKSLPRLHQCAPIQRWLRDPYPGVRRYNVELAFYLLGTNASFAVPELTRLMRDPKTDWGGATATYPLSCIGPAGLPPLLAEAANPDSKCRLAAISDIRCMGSNALPAIPFLIQCLSNTNKDVASIAAWSLSCLELQPELVLPALAHALPVINTDAQGWVCTWLVKFPAHRPLARQAFASAWKNLNADERAFFKDLVRNTGQEEAEGLLPEKPALE